MQDEFFALRQIVQEITLSALGRSQFFKHAAFQGGTCLRIMHGLERYSEDLDFVLLHHNPRFIWESYLEKIQ